MKLTPEPWRADGRQVFSEDQDLVARCGECVDGDAKANARLIAASRNLLKLLVLAQNLAALSNVNTESDEAWVAWIDATDELLTFATSEPLKSLPSYIISDNVREDEEEEDSF